MQTNFTKLVQGMSTPIVLAPMAGAAGGLLASQVSRAGGLGFIGAGTFDTKRLEVEIDIFNQNIGTQQRLGVREQFGIGFLAWPLTAMHKGAPPLTETTEHDPISPALAVIDLALKARPVGLWLSFGSKEEMIGWSRVIRDREAILNKSSPAQFTPLKLFIGVGDEVEARAAVEECGADVLVVQGFEAGGHGLASSPPLSTLLPLIISLLPLLEPSNPSGSKVLVLAAGGLMNGSHLASVLAQGADGAVFGTRFLFTSECNYNDIQKGMLISAKASSTVRSLAFDEARATYGWPEGVDGRGIMNKTVDDFDMDAGCSAEFRQAVYKKAEEEGDTTRLVAWAGAGVGLVNKIIPAQQVVEEISSEAIRCIKTLTSLLPPALKLKQSNGTHSSHKTSVH